MSNGEYIQAYNDPDYSAIVSVEILSIFLGVFSLFFPLSVVFILLYRYEKLVLGKSLIHYILVIGIADAGTSIAIAMGYPNKGSTCYVQGFMFIFFGRVSWYFTDVLIFQLFCLVVFKKYFISIKVVHIIIWPLMIIEQFLPYAFGVKYGRNNVDNKPVGRCFLTAFNNDFNNNVYNSIEVFVIEFFISFFFIILLAIGIVGYSYYISKTEPLNLTKIAHVRESISTAILYPIAMIIFYVPSFIYSSINGLYIKHMHHNLHNFQVIFNYLVAIQTLYGVTLTIIFYTKTKMARREWFLLYQQIFNKKNELQLPLHLSMSERSSDAISVNDRS